MYVDRAPNRFQPSFDARIGICTHHRAKHRFNSRLRLRLRAVVANASFLTLLPIASFH
jgi:hypothetical protein